MSNISTLFFFYSFFYPWWVTDAHINVLKRVGSITFVLATLKRQRACWAANETYALAVPPHNFAELASA